MFKNQHWTGMSTILIGIIHWHMQLMSMTRIGQFSSREWLEIELPVEKKYQSCLEGSALSLLQLLSIVSAQPQTHLCIPHTKKSTSVKNKKTHFQLHLKRFLPSLQMLLVRILHIRLVCAFDHGVSFLEGETQDSGVRR